MPEAIVNGRRISAIDGASVAGAVYAAGEFQFRRSVKGQPRAPLCGMGICFECRVTIDGKPHQRSCQIPLRNGMVIETP